MNRLLVLLLLPGCWLGNDDADKTRSGASIGRVVETGNAARSTLLTYDARGHVTQAVHAVDKIPQTYLYRYGYAGGEPTGRELGEHLVASTFPGGETIVRQRDASGAIQQITTTRPDGTVDLVQRGVAFDRHGQVTRTRHGNGTRTTVTRDPVTEQVRFEVTMRESDGLVLQGFSYRHDRQGRPTEVSEHCVGAGDPETGFTCCDPSTGSCARGPTSARYVRDRAGRIAKRIALDPGGADGAQQAFAHDAAGNLTLHGGIAQTYGAAGKPHAIASTAAGDRFDYDPSGNVVGITANGATTTLEWSGRGMPIRSSGPAGSIERSYLGEAMYKRVDTTADGTHVTHFLPDLRLEDGVPRRSIDNLAERVTPRDALTFTHANHLGSSTLVTDATGKAVHRAAFDTYGNAIRVASGDYQARKTFTGKELEASGLLDFGARLYNPRTGRFLSPDRVVDGLDPYAYAMGDPISGVDPSGHAVQDPKADTIVMPATRVPGTDKVPYNCQNPPAFSSCPGSGGGPSATPDPVLVRQAAAALGPTHSPTPQTAGPSGRSLLEGLSRYDGIDDKYIAPGLWGIEKIAERFLFKTEGSIIQWRPGVRQVWRYLPKVGKLLGGVVRGVPVLGIAATWANVAVELSDGPHDGVDTAIIVGSAILETALDFTPLAPAAGLIGNGVTWLARYIRSDLQKGENSLLIQSQKVRYEHGPH